MKIALLINSLEMGGAERMGCFLAGKWVEAGHSVAILTLNGPHVPYFQLDHRVSVHHLDVAGPSKNLFEVLGNFLRRIGRVRRFIKSGGYDLIVGFGGPCLALASLSVMGLSAKSIAYEQTDPLFTERIMGPIRCMIHRMAMGHADAIVVQSKAARDVLDTRQWKRTAIIPNPVRPVSVRAMPGVPGDDGHFKIVALGRLDPIKGYDVLLRAWAKIQASLPNWILIIHGEGVERLNLERIALEEKLQGRVFLPGATEEADRRLAEANLFVMTSRTEGFPNSLCEAMAVGLPAISTDCRCGPADIVNPGKDGVLVPVDDVDALANAILSLASDPKRLAAMGEEAHGITRRYAEAIVMRMWDDVFESLNGKMGSL